MPPAEELSAQMGSDAEICERLARKNRFGLDGRLGSLVSLEELIDSLTPWSQASEEIRQAMVRIIGAYFGETLRNSIGGSWVSDEEYRTPAIQVSQALRIFPHARVQKRWEQGSEFSLSSFVDGVTALTSGPKGDREPRSDNVSELSGRGSAEVDISFES